MSVRGLARAARTLVGEQFDLRPSEGVLITADARTEPALIAAIAAAADAGQIVGPKSLTALYDRVRPIFE